MEQFLGEEPASTEWIIIAQATDIRSLQLPTSVLRILSLPGGGAAAAAAAAPPTTPPPTTTTTTTTATGRVASRLLPAPGAQHSRS